MDHSDLLQFHFFNQNEIRIELIAERAACRIDGHSSAGHDAAEPAVEADRFQPHRSPCGRSTDAAPMVQAACCLIFAPEAFGRTGLTDGAGGFLPGVPVGVLLGHD
jgi:hypothetical protein